MTRCVSYLMTIGMPSASESAGGDTTTRSPRRQPGDHFDAIAVGAAGLHGAALHRVLPHEEDVTGAVARS